jgi:hypothetical protein
MKTFDREASGEATATGRESKTKKIIMAVDLVNGSGEALAILQTMITRPKRFKA